MKSDVASRDYTKFGKGFHNTYGGISRRPRIIIFDDDAFLLSMLKRYFEGCNFEVHAFNRPILCPSCENTKPCADMIITDFKMPLINGIDLLDHQAMQGCCVNVKNKAIMSAKLPEEHHDKIGELAGSLIQKPFSLQELDEWINACIGRVDMTSPLGSNFIFSGRFDR